MSVFKCRCLGLDQIFHDTVNFRSLLTVLVELFVISPNGENAMFVALVFSMLNDENGLFRYERTNFEHLS